MCLYKPVECTDFVQVLCIFWNIAHLWYFAYLTPIFSHSLSILCIILVYVYRITCLFWSFLRYINIFSAYFVQMCYILLHMVCISSASWYFVHTLHNWSILACSAYFAHISYILFCFPCPGVEKPQLTTVTPVCAFSHDVSEKSAITLVARRRVSI